MQSLNAAQARKLTNASESRYIAFFEHVIAEIKKAADAGQYKIYLPAGPTVQMEERVKEELIQNGFAIKAYSSDTWNTAIHW